MARSLRNLLVCAMVLASGCASSVTTDIQTCRSQAVTAGGTVYPPATVLPVSSLHSALLTNELRDELDATARAAMASVVRIQATLERDQGVRSSDANLRATAHRSGGTGIIIAAEGIILTAEHVVRGAETVTVTLPDGSAYPAQRVLVDNRRDLAVLRIDARSLGALQITDKPITEGAIVIALAARRYDRPRCHRTGTVVDESVSLQDQLDPTGRRLYDNLLESTTKLETGFSGGPLIDAHGRLVGVNVAASGPDGSDRARGYAQPFDAATRRAIDRLVRQAAD